MDETEDDHRLAGRAATGDGDAFAALLERHYDRIHALGWRFLGSSTEAEDLAQDVALMLGRRIRSWRGEAAFTTWLYRVVLNAARDRMRRHGREARATATFAELDGLERGAEAARAETADWLRGAIAGLKPDLRETAVLVLDEGLSHAEAGQVLEIREATVSWRMHEVRKALKAMAEAGKEIG